MNGEIECAFTSVIYTQPDVGRTRLGKEWCAVNVRIGDGEETLWARVAAYGELRGVSRPRKTTDDTHNEQYSLDRIPYSGVGQGASAYG